MPMQMIFNLGDCQGQLCGQHWTVYQTQRYQFHRKRNLASYLLSFSLKFVNSASASWSASVGSLDMELLAEIQTFPDTEFFAKICKMGIGL